MITAQWDAIQDRAEWATKRDALIAEFTAKMADLALEDYRHQRGVRGCSMEAAIDEVRTGTERTVEGIAENVIQETFSRIAQSGIL